MSSPELTGNIVTCTIKCHDVYLIVQYNSFSTLFYNTDSIKGLKLVLQTKQI